MKRLHWDRNNGNVPGNNTALSKGNKSVEGDKYVESHAANTIQNKIDNTRLGKCEVCAEKFAAYTCPKCEVKTCCLRCVQIHKKELDCDGIRDRTKFLPLRKMTKLDFMNDYYFLEECTRFTEDRKQDHIKNITRYNKALPQHLFRLRGAAAERGTKLRFLLQNFSRHKENSTYYDWKKRKIFWRIEWIFVNADSRKYIDERCDEDEPLHKLLDKYMNTAGPDQVPQKKALEYYQSVGVFRIKIMLKSEGIKRSNSRFFVLDAGKSLKENLRGKTVVEFPCIYVSYEAKPIGFDIIESDEDIEAEAKAHQTSIDEMHEKQIKLKNYSQRADNDDGGKHAEKLLIENQREERRRKREEFENAPNNYLFADEKLWELFSSSDSSEAESDGNAREQENDETV